MTMLLPTELTNHSTLGSLGRAGWGKEKEGRVGVASDDKTDRVVLVGVLGAHRNELK